MVDEDLLLVLEALFPMSSLRTQHDNRLEINC